MLVSSSIFFIWLSIACGNVNNVLSVKTDSDYRLPTNVIPVEYDISLSIFLDEDVLPGKVTITLNVTEKNVKEIRLHGSKIKIENCTLVNSNSTEIGISNIDDETKGSEEYFIISLSQTLDPTMMYTLKINYTFHVSTDMNGFYRSYYEENGKNMTIGVTQFEPTYARRVFPCFDEPGFKAKFIITLMHDPEYTAVRANSYGNSELTRDGSKMITRFDETEIMATYLVAFMLTKFPSKTSVSNNQMQAYAPSSIMDRNQADYMLTIGALALQYMEEYTGQRFDYKTDLVVIPDFSAGAMENWGLITGRVEEFVYDPKESSSNAKQTVATTTTHEIAHMWFGNLVTLDWWNNLWLNEGFATYFENFGTQHIVDSSWHLNEQFIVNVLQSSFGSDALETAFAVRTNVSTPDEINNAFGSASYDKAGSILRMVELTIGSSTFQKGLQLYQKKYRFQNVVPQNLYDSLQYQIDQNGINIDISSIMEPYISQSGMPVVNVVNTKPGILTLSQERFLYTKAKSASQTFWNIPISYASQDNNDFTDTTPKLLLNATNNNVQLKVSNLDTFWIVFNVQASGYYRVNYDTNLLKILKSMLQSKNFGGIPEINRGQLMNDILNLARGGMVKYDTALDFLTYLPAETEYTPWESTLGAVYFIAHRMQQNATNIGYLNRFMQDQLKTVYSKYQLKNSPSFENNHIQKLTEAMILTAACYFQNADCIEQAVSVFQQWKKDPSKKVYPVDVRSVVYCTGIRNGSSSDWDFLWSEFPKNPLEKRTIINALGCNSDTGILNKYLSYSLDPSKIRSQDANYVFSSVYYGTPNGVEVALTFLENNINEMAVKYGGLNALGNCILGLANYLTTQSEVNRLQSIINKNKVTIEPVAVIANNAMDIANTGLQWNIDYENDVMNYLLSGQNSGSMQITITWITIFLLCFWSFIM